MANRYEFITESIMSSSSAMLRDDFDLQGCECIGECNEDCTCLEMSHSSRTYFQSKGSSILLSDANYPIFECSSNCSCHCTTNRSYQCPNITVFDTHKTGFGLKATSEIKKGTVISEYIGIILSEEEAAKEAKSSSDTEFYLMTINEHFSSGVMRTHISAKKKGNLSRFINHSCSPNCSRTIIRKGSTMPRVLIVASKTIAKDNEITFHYHPDGFSTKTVKCLCGSRDCQEYLPV